MRTVISKLSESEITLSDIQELIDPSFSEVLDLMQSKKLDWKVLDVVMKLKKDIKWEEDFDTYWEMIYQTIVELSI